jgi:hypothetical protein
VINSRQRRKSRNKDLRLGRNPRKQSGLGGKTKSKTRKRNGAGNGNATNNPSLRIRPKTKRLFIAAPPGMGSLHILRIDTNYSANLPAIQPVVLSN